MVLVTAISIVTGPNKLTVLLEYIVLFNLNRHGNIKEIQYGTKILHVI